MFILPFAFHNSYLCKQQSLVYTWINSNPTFNPPPPPPQTPSLLSFIAEYSGSSLCADVPNKLLRHGWHCNQAGHRDGTFGGFCSYRGIFVIISIVWSVVLQLVGSAFVSSAILVLTSRDKARIYRGWSHSQITPKFHERHSCSRLLGFLQGLPLSDPWFLQGKHRISTGIRSKKVSSGIRVDFAGFCWISCQSNF